jgi:hypothetical protein
LPIVAEAPACQYTFDAFAPFVSRMRAWAAGVGAPGMAVIELPAWNTNTAFGSPPPSSVTSPAMTMVEPEV